MKELLEKTLLKDTIEFNGSISELKEQIRLKKNRKFDLEWISETKFKFLSKFSLGTMMVSGFPNAVDGIKGYGFISKLDNGKTRIELSTTVRVELYFTVSIFILIFIIAFFAEENIPYWVYLLLPFSVLWFWLIFRLQEKKLFGKMKNYIKTELKTHKKML